MRLLHLPYLHRKVDRIPLHLVLGTLIAQLIVLTNAEIPPVLVILLKVYLTF